MKVRRQSLISGQWNTREIDVTEEQLARIDAPGRLEYIQQIVPHLNPDDREFLMTGILPEEWDDATNTEDA